MTRPIPREARAFAFGLLLGVGGSPYEPREIINLVRERFGVNIASKTISNWKGDIPGYMQRYNIGEDYIREVIERGLLGAEKGQGSAGEDDREVIGRLPGEGEDDREVPEEVASPPSFSSLAEMVGYMEKQGFVVATSDQDLRDILERNDYTLLKKGQLEIGPQILSWTPIELDFEAVGKQIAGNVVILWYWAVFRKLCELKGDETPDLAEYVTSCVVDAMTAPGREWMMALVKGGPP